MCLHPRIDIDVRIAALAPAAGAGSSERAGRSPPPPRSRCGSAAAPAQSAPLEVGTKLRECLNNVKREGKIIKRRFKRFKHCESI